MDSNATIRVALAGAAGKMGREIVRSLIGERDLTLVAALDRNYVGTSLTELVGPEAPDILIGDKVGHALDESKPDVFLDFTQGGSAPGHVQSALKRGIACVVGATGINDADLRELALDAKEHKTPVLIVPNFAIGAVLMMHFSAMAARWMPQVEIIEMHHDQKSDAPSGTAMLTAERIYHERTDHAPVREPLSTKVEGVRGGQHFDVPIHSVRLPGLLAHQVVMFGGHGETLTLRHDSLDRTSFMDGVKLAIRGVRKLEGLVHGLDCLLFNDGI